MIQSEFNILTRDDLEKLKFVLDSSWDVAIRVIWSSWATNYADLTDVDWTYSWAWKTVKINATNDWLDFWLTLETAVPVWAVFTDTTYSVWDWGLTEINFTTALSTLLWTAEQGVNKNAVNWYAGLDAWGKINPLQLPALAISETFVVASEVAQLALTVQEWDIAVRTDLNESYIALNDTNASMSDWQKLLTPTDAVSSVAWKTGVVTLDSSDVWLSNVENTALSTWVWSANITTLWTVTSWNVDAIVTSTSVWLSNVENTALSTWAWSTNITTLWTIWAGTWNWTIISIVKWWTWSSTLAGASITTYTGTETLTNKRITHRVNTITTSSTPTPNWDTTDEYTITALWSWATIWAPTGTPTNWQKLIIRIKDNWTARTLSWNAIYRVGDIALPTTTVISKTQYLWFIYNSTDTKWDLLAYIDNL